MSADDATEKPVRKFPPPCWTQDEALALIDTYRQRWYALRRGYLRTADWEAVAAAVADRCPDASPPKTSAQCRHKIEKLRQRYRAERQRSLSFPGRFFSSWFFFEYMDAMENGTSPNIGSNQEAVDRGGSGNGSLTKTLIDQNLVTVGFSSKISRQIDENSNSKLSADRNLIPLGFRAKNRGKIDGKSSPSIGSGVLNGYSSHFEIGSDEDEGVDFGGGFRVKASIDGNSAPPMFRVKKISKNFGNSDPKFDGNSDGGNEESGFFANTWIEHDTVPPGFRPKKYAKTDEIMKPKVDYTDSDYNVIDADGGIWVKIPGGSNSVPPGFKENYSVKMNKNSSPSIDPRILNGLSSSLRFGYEKKSGGRGTRRARDPVEDMVLSINMLGEGFVKMEKMKMEMAREIEKMRMEMEIKRNELILESQKQIVDAFVKGLVEIKSKKVKTSVSLEK